MKKFLVIFFLLITFLLEKKVNAQDSLAYWSFDEAQGNTVTEAISHTNFTINSVRNISEHVKGVHGNGIRTDGYSSYLQGDLNTLLPSKIISLTCWVALESYPVSTASLWTKINPVNNSGLDFSINKFGILQCVFYLNGAKLILSSGFALPHNKWNFLGVSINTSIGHATLFVNGESVDSINFNTGSLVWPTSTIYIGKSLTDTLFGNLYSTTLVNGILDEMVLWNKELSGKNIDSIYLSQLPVNDPDLSVPAIRFANDFHRPEFHLIPNANWTNESHGLIYYKGIYNIFSQRNPNGPYLTQINWGHYQSADLINWQEKPVKLWPELGYDQAGIWAGHLVLNNNVPTIFYTGVNGQYAGICSATSTDSMQSFQKNPNNPLIPHSPVAFINNDFRDPYIFKENGLWYMIVGSGLKTVPQKGCVFLYKSKDIENWQFVGPLFTGDPNNDNSGIFWEVPVFWKFGNKYILIVNKVPQPNIPARTLYWIGNFVNETFVPDNPIPKNLELINVLLSPSVNYDEFGNVVAIGIVPDLLPPSEQYKNGWANLFSFPRVWQLQGDTLLIQSPHPNLLKIRNNRHAFNNLSLLDGGNNYLGNLYGNQLELEVNFLPGSAAQTGIMIGMNPDGSEYTKIYYDYSNSKIVVDRSKSSLNKNVPLDIMAENYYLDPRKKTKWRVYIDGSVVDVFVNDKAAFSTRIFPQKGNSNFIDLFALGGNALVDTAFVWSLGSNGSIITSINSPNTVINNSSLAYLDKVWPNPFTNDLTIFINSSVTETIHLELYDIKGRRLREEASMIYSGYNKVKWSNINNNGMLSSGIYIVKLIGDHVKNKSEVIFKL